MRSHSIYLFRTAVAVVIGTQILSGPVLSQQPERAPRAPARAQMIDVALASERALVGEIRDAQGQLAPGIELALWRANEFVRRVRSDRHGKFRFPGLRGGVYRIATNDSVVICRVWSGGLAPPNSLDRLLIVTQAASARGQQPINEVFCFNPFLMGTVIAAAIAIPIAVRDPGDGQLPDGS